jgi:hypothetical protein
VPLKLKYEKFKNFDFLTENVSKFSEKIKYAQTRKFFFGGGGATRIKNLIPDRGLYCKGLRYEF